MRVCKLPQNDHLSWNVRQFKSFARNNSVGSPSAGNDSVNDALNETVIATSFA